ncbi:MAG: hypothetical protein V1874_15870 [Spirochaetota bacterium]
MDIEKIWILRNRYYSTVSLGDENNMTYKFIKDEADSPPVLIKFFDCENHADNFLKGNIIIRKIEVFKTVENKRRDETENIEHSKYEMSDGILDCERTFINPVYILCLSGPDCNLSRCYDNFGTYTVLINDIVEFKKRLYEKWKSFNFALGVTFHDVVYNKSEVIEAPQYLMSPHGTSLRQKEKSHDYANEYRFIFKCKMNITFQFKEKLELEIGDITNIAERKICIEELKHALLLKNSK